MNDMKKLLFAIFLINLLSSCSTVKFIDIDVCKPAPITFKQGTKKVLIVDNSFKTTYFQNISHSEGILNLTNILIDSIRPSLLNNISLFMNEDRIFDSIEIYPFYPKPIYHYQENDSLSDLPLTKEEIRGICQKTGSDALVSLDLIAPFIKNKTRKSVNIESYTYSRVYTSDGSSLSAPLLHASSLFFPINSLDSLGSIANQIAINHADMIASSVSPTWEIQERVLFREDSKETSATKHLIETNMWKEAYAVWDKLFKEEKNKRKRLRYIVNMTVASEFMDDIVLAQNLINSAYMQLSESDKSQLAEHIRYYRGIIRERVANAPKLQEQLHIGGE